MNLILNRKSLIRILAATTIVSIAVVAGFKWAFPQMAMPNLWPILFALPGILLMFVFQFAILTLIPPTATIRPDKILVQHGQSVTLIDLTTVTATYLTFHPENRIRLRICYSKKSKRKFRVIGVPPTVDFNRLSELLPIPPVVRDARNRSLTAQKPTEQSVAHGGAGRAHSGINVVRRGPVNGDAWPDRKKL
jgi:hypothetical protein